MQYEYNPALNKYFDQNWNDTPIQYEGIRFEKPQDNEWISIQLHPYMRDEQTFGRGVKREIGLVKVFAYSRTATRSYLLASKVCEFLDEIRIGSGLHFDVGRGDGRGAMELSKGLFETLTIFNITSFEVECKMARRLSVDSTAYTVDSTSISADATII